MVSQLLDLMEDTPLAGHALEMMGQGTLQAVGAVADHQSRGGFGEALAVECAKERRPGLSPFALRPLPMHACPVPIGPHTKRTQYDPRLLALDRAPPALGLVALLPRGLGDLDPQAIDQEKRWWPLKDWRLEPRQWRGHTRHHAVTGRQRAPRAES